MASLSQPIKNPLKMTFPKIIPNFSNRKSLELVHYGHGSAVIVCGVEAEEINFVTSENSDDVGESSGPATASGVGDGGAYEEQEGSLRERLRLWSRGKGFWMRNLRWATRESEVDVLMDEGKLDYPSFVLVRQTTRPRGERKWIYKEEELENSDRLITASDHLCVSSLRYRGYGFYHMLMREYSSSEGNP
ncbi:hypothetical protein Fmac_008144 [Flemingia macrophylla]|uniref:Uncharacterized protein n=1 Tax=Flemingia macrophylla TaxID=520843 RepID=A0ABD1MWK2_9FABA